MTPAQAWSEFVSQGSHSFTEARERWETLAGEHDPQAGPMPMWSPTEATTQLEDWISARGFSGIDEFYRWSCDEPHAFWSEAAERIGIAFHDAAERTSNADNAWFPGAQLNIAESCFLAKDNKTAIISQRPGAEPRQISYGELKSLTARVANSLRTRGFNPGDAIAVVLPMTIESVAIYLGIILAGCAVVSVADSFAAAEIAARLRIADARAVFTYDILEWGGKRIPVCDRVFEATELPVIIVPWNEETEIIPRYDDATWGEFLTDDDRFLPAVRASMDRINILFSSGTTGDPKAIPWHQITPLKCGIDALLLHDLNENDIAAWPTNLGWMMGPWLIFASLLNRATIALFEDVPKGEPFGKFVADTRVSMLGVVPTLVRAWRAERSIESCDWSGIRCFSSTGESSDPEDMFYLSWLAGFRPIIEYCGGTEIAGGYISSTLARSNAPSCFNQVAFGIGFSLRDEAGSPASKGEVFLSGKSVGLSCELLNADHDAIYFGKTPLDQNGQPLRRHGDELESLAAGYFRVLGRADDTMNLGGVKISSVEIEQVVNTHPAISESAAVAAGSGPSQLVLFVVPAAEIPQAIQKELQATISQQLNPLFRVSSVHVIDALPRTASNKVMRRRLRDQLG